MLTTSKPWLRLTLGVWLLIATIAPAICASLCGAEVCGACLPPPPQHAMARDCGHCHMAAAVPTASIGSGELCCCAKHGTVLAAIKQPDKGKALYGAVHVAFILPAAIAAHADQPVRTIFATYARAGPEQTLGPGIRPRAPPKSGLVPRYSSTD